MTEKGNDGEKKEGDGWREIAKEEEEGRKGVGAAGCRRRGENSNLIY